MKTLSLSKANVRDCALHAAEVLRAGGVIVYPTDTLYGLGADALSDAAVAKICAIKGRSERKPIHCIVADLAMAERYGIMGSEARMLAQYFWPGPLTLVAPKKADVRAGVAALPAQAGGIATIGLRVPNHEFCVALARAFGKPYTTTSANVSGKDSPRTTEGILAQLGPSAHHIDLIVAAGELPPSLPSTVVAVGETGVAILREGAIGAGEIFDVLGKLSREHEGL